MMNEELELEYLRKYGMLFNRLANSIDHLEDSFKRLVGSLDIGSIDNFQKEATIIFTNVANTLITNLNHDYDNAEYRAAHVLELPTSQIYTFNLYVNKEYITTIRMAFKYDTHIQDDQIKFIEFTLIKLDTNDFYIDDILSDLMEYIKTKYGEDKMPNTNDVRLYNKLKNQPILL